MDTGQVHILSEKPLNLLSDKQSGRHTESQVHIQTETDIPTGRQIDILTDSFTYGQTYRLSDMLIHSRN